VAVTLEGGGVDRQHGRDVRGVTASDLPGDRRRGSEVDPPVAHGPEPRLGDGRQGPWPRAVVEPVGDVGSRGLEGHLDGVAVRGSDPVAGALEPTVRAGGDDGRDVVGGHPAVPGGGGVDERPVVVLPPVVEGEPSAAVLADDRTAIDATDRTGALGVAVIVTGPDHGPGERPGRGGSVGVSGRGRG